MASYDAIQKEITVNEWEAEEKLVSSFASRINFPTWQRSFL